MALKTEQRIVRVSIPLYKEITKKASTYGYNLTQALEKIIEGYKRKIHRQQLVIEQREGTIAKGIDELTDLTVERKHFPLGKCKYCGKPLIWDLTVAKELKQLEKALKGWFHDTCKPKE